MITSGAGVTLAFSAVRKSSAWFAFSLLLWAFVGIASVEIGIEDVGVAEEGLFEFMLVEELGDMRVRGEFLVADTDWMFDIESRKMLKKKDFILVFGDLRDS